MALCGYYGFGNLGDELLAEALLSALEREGVSRDEAVLLTANPGAGRALGVQAVQRWSVRDVFGALRRSDTLLLGGGGLFQDSTSLRSCAYYWGVVRLARLAGAVPWCVGQSVGPFRTAVGRTLARKALADCAARGVRDDRSRALLAQWGLSSALSPDPVVSLPASGEHSGGEGRTLLLNVRPWTDDLADRTAREASRFAEVRGLSVTGVALSDEDRRLMEDQIARGVLAAREVVLLDAESWRLRSEALFADAAAVVSMRYHFGLLALLARLPVCLSAYDPKVAELANEWGVPAWTGEGALPEPTRPAGATDELPERFADFFHRLWADVRLAAEGGV